MSKKVLQGINEKANGRKPEVNEASLYNKESMRICVMKRKTLQGINEKANGRKPKRNKGEIKIVMKNIGNIVSGGVAA